MLSTWVSVFLPWSRTICRKTSKLSWKLRTAWLVPAAIRQKRTLIWISQTRADSLPPSIRGGAFIDSATSFGLIRGGHVDATVLGALQVDEKGNLANWIIPGKMVPGMGGAMDLVVGASNVIVAMEHTQKGAHKILKNCTLPLTAKTCVTKIITEMAVINVTDKGLELVEYNPEFTVEQIQEATEATLIVSPDLKPIE